jgi:hypothetical protein
VLSSPSPTYSAEENAGRLKKASQLFLKFLCIVTPYRKYTRVLTFEKKKRSQLFLKKVLCIVTLYWKYTMVLTFENLKMVAGTS